MSTELETLSDIQNRLYTVENLIDAQDKKQTELTIEMLNFSKDVMCELRQLSLVRSAIIGGNGLNDIHAFIRSQTMQGLNFSSLQYCPEFFENNTLNHYMTFISELRLRPDILSKLLYHYAFAKPENVFDMAYSVFLTLFQQGWCIEEDKLMTEVLKSFADYQFANEAKVLDLLQEESISTDKSMKKPLTSPESILRHLHPFDKYVTAYLFNGASFAYLQFALSQIVSILHSSSSLRNLHNKFTQRNGLLAQFEYWEFIVHQAVECFDKLIMCVELLPAGVTSLFKHIREHENGGDDRCILLFFESFVNRALDNPAVLGLVPWHPDGAEWSPSKDISSVFRAKYNEMLPSRSYGPLHTVLSCLPEFKLLDFKKFLSVLTDESQPHTILISETELLHTNPLFPKELIITGKDIVMLHEAALSIPPAELDKKFADDIVGRLNAVPTLNKSAEEHFRIALQMQKEVAKAAKKIKAISLFNVQGKLTNKLDDDPYAGFFCDVITKLPRFSDFIKFNKPESSTKFLEQMQILAPLFICDDEFTQAEAVLNYIVNGNCKVSDLLPRLEAVTSYRYMIAMDTADKTSSINTQHQRILEAYKIVETMRENVQTHLLYRITDIFIRFKISKDFSTIMSKSYDFINNFASFKESSTFIMEVKSHFINDLDMTPQHVKQSVRILFFKITDNVTCQRFLTSEVKIWKKSCIISKIVKENRTKIVNELLKSWRNEFELRQKYFKRAADLLGHIKNSSGISVVLYYIDECVSTIQDLIKVCPKKLSLENCILWVIINTTAYQVYGIGKFINHFLLESGFSDMILTSSESQHLSVFSSAICLLLNACKDTGANIDDSYY